MGTKTDYLARVEAYLDAASDVLGLPIDPTHRPGVIANLERLFDQARLFAEAELPDALEPAEFWRP
jgi:hypothetical protein